MSREKKVEETVMRAVRLLPGDVGGQLKSMLTVRTLAIMVASLVGLAIAQAFGIGEFIDALILISGICFCGLGIVDGGRDLFPSMRMSELCRATRIRRIPRTHRNPRIRSPCALRVSAYNRAQTSSKGGAGAHPVGG